VLERHGGTVEKFIGDAVMAVFGIPTMHEDDAVRAVRAAAELRDELETLNVELEQERGVRIALRTGVNTGEVVVGDPSAQQFYATGDAVNVAARLEQAAGPGEIVLGDSTRQLVRDAVELEPMDQLDLKGKTDRVPAWRLVRVDPEAAGFTRRLESPLVGRREELERLAEVYEEARDSRSPRLCTILGAPGVGKSRLTAELAAHVEREATVLLGRCLSYGEGITYWPLMEIVQQAEERFHLGDMLAERPRELIETLTGSGQAGGSTEEAFWAVRKLCEALARERPLVIVLDDVHWAETTFLDLVEHVLEFAEDTPLLLVALARPEFLDERPLWASQRDDLALIRLEPLSDEQTDVLIDALAGGARLPEEIRRRIGAASAGNPLFLEQMLAMLSGNGHGGGDVAVPPTIQALLAARIDELAPDERAVAEPAAVVGQEFWREAVVELCPPDTAVSASLQRLVRKELIGRARSSLAEEDAFRFRHVLIRDAAYAGIAKGRRAELHERFADWLERTVPEYEEVVGYHLEQAFTYRDELGTLGEAEAALARRAAEQLEAAGHRAYAHGDVRAAANLLGRAVALASAAGSPPIDVLVELGSALADTGELERAATVLHEAVERARQAGDRRGELLAKIEYEIAHSMYKPNAEAETKRDSVEQTVAAAEELGDDVILAKAWKLLGERRNAELQCEEWAEALERALVHAERAGDEREADEDRIFLSSALYFGPTPADEAISRCEEMLERASRRARAGILTSLAGLRSMRGEFDTARALYAEAEEILEDLGFRVRMAGRAMIYGDIERLADNLPAGEAKMRWACDVLEQMGETGRLSTLAGILADIVYRQGRYDEADSLADLSKRVTAPDDLASQMLWRSVRAKIAARRGEFEVAQALAQEAATLADSTDAFHLHGDVLMDLAEVLRLADRPEEAAAALKRAIELYEAKGISVLAGKARALRSELTG
jgi:tetratricopeptide (TPR) repeat protein